MMEQINVERRLEVQKLSQRMQCYQGIKAAAELLALTSNPKHQLYNAQLEETLLNFIREHIRAVEGLSPAGKEKTSGEVARALPSSLNIPSLRGVCIPKKNGEA